MKKGKCLLANLNLKNVVCSNLCVCLNLKKYTQIANGAMKNPIIE